MNTAIETSEFAPAAAEAAETGVWHWNGPLDIRQAAQFRRRAIEAVKTDKNGPIVLDLSQAPHMDASGLQILVALAVRALTVGRLFEIARASPAIRRDLEMAGVGYLMRQE